MKSIRISILLNIILSLPMIAVAPKKKPTAPKIVQKKEQPTSSFKRIFARYQREIYIGSAIGIASGLGLGSLWYKYLSFNSTIVPPQKDQVKHRPTPPPLTNPELDSNPQPLVKSPESKKEEATVQQNGAVDPIEKNETQSLAPNTEQLANGNEVQKLDPNTISTESVELSKKEQQENKNAVEGTVSKDRINEKAKRSTKEYKKEIEKIEQEIVMLEKKNIQQKLAAIEDQITLVQALGEKQYALEVEEAKIKDMITNSEIVQAEQSLAYKQIKDMIEGLEQDITEQKIAMLEQEIEITKEIADKQEKLTAVAQEIAAIKKANQLVQDKPSKKEKKTRTPRSYQRAADKFQKKAVDEKKLSKEDAIEVLIAAKKEDVAINLVVKSLNTAFEGITDAKKFESVIKEMTSNTRITFALNITDNTKVTGVVRALISNIAQNYAIGNRQDGTFYAIE